MTRSAVLSLALALFLGSAAVADAPVTSPRPEPRPVQSSGADVTRVAPSGLIEQIVREVSVPRSALVVQAALAAAVAQSPRPPERPENLKRRNIVAAAGFRVAPPPAISGAKGAVCGDPAIQGSALSPIAGRIRGCGVAAPVKVTSVAGVTLSNPATIDCNTARALKTWIERGVKPTIGKLGGGVARLEVAAHYSCRTRNNRPGERISEHGKGRAIDIAAIVLRNDVALSVLRGWRDPQHGKMLRAMHGAACGPFGTVLGPNADRFHQNHFHFDTARHRGGSHCR